MTSQADFIRGCAQWMCKDGPMDHSIISSRARYARNLEHIPFAPRAKREQLCAVAERIDEAIGSSSFFRDFRRLNVNEINSLHRMYLKESHLLSSEMEQGGEYRVIYISPDYRISIMVNEEDHLRMQCLDVGFQLQKVHALLTEVEEELGRVLKFAHSERLGYLTACPTNVGTGLRLSVMLHLPGLVLVNKIDEILQSVLPYGLTVRGIYGENSENFGDFFQISNEVTLGKSWIELCTTLHSMAEQVVEHELKARDALFEQRPEVTRDVLSRALGVLQNAWIMDSVEAMSHLSKIRLGIDHGCFRPLTHPDLSRLMIEMLPAHLQCREGGQLPVERRDSLRARYLHKRFQGLALN